MFLISQHCVFLSIFSRVVGDIVEAVVPYMGDSISDGTLVKFLKSTLSCVHLLSISYINRFSSHLYVVNENAKQVIWVLEPCSFVYGQNLVIEFKSMSLLPKLKLTRYVDSLTCLRLEHCKFSSQTEPNRSLNLSLPFRWRLMWLVLKLAL